MNDDIFYRSYDRAGRPVSREAEAEAANPEGSTLGETASAIADNDWWTSAAWRAATGPSFEADESFDIRDQSTLAGVLEEFEVPEEYASRMLAAESRDHARYISERINTELENERTIQEFGNPALTFVTRMGINMVDPLAVAATIGSGGIAGATRIGVAATRTGRAVRAGLMSGGVDVAGETFRVSQSETAGADDVAFAFAGSFLFGMAGGAIGRGLDPTETEMLRGVVDRYKEDIASGSFGGSSVGAARNVEDAGPVGQDRLAEFEAEEGEVSRSFGNLWTRFDAAGRLGRSSSPVVRRVAQWLLPDGSGREGGAVNTFAAEEYKGAITRRYETTFFRDMDQAFRQWRQATGARRGRESLREFNRLVSRYTRGPESMGNVAGLEAIAAGSTSQQRFYREILGEAKAAELMENIEARANYVNRMWIPENVRALAREIGDDQVVKLLANAIRIENADGTTLSETLPVASALFKVLNKADLGVTFRGASGNREAVSGTIRGVLEEDTRMSTEDFEDFVEELTELLAPSESGSAGKGTRSMRRIVLNENVGMSANGRQVYLDEMLENDAITLASMYVNQVGGRIGIAKASGGKIKSDADFERYLRRMLETAPATGGKVDSIAREAEVLEKYYNNLVGKKRLHKGFGSDTMSAMQALRDLNFARFMGQVGFSQASEAGTLIAAYGIRNFLSQAAPALKTLIADYNGKGSTLGDETTDTINGFWGFGDQYVRSRMAAMQNRLDAAGMEPQESAQRNIKQGAGRIDDRSERRGIDRFADFAQDSARAVSMIGGLQPITDTLHNMAIRMGLAHFASRAARGKDLIPNARRRAAMGLSEEDAVRVSEALNEAVVTKRNAAGGFDIEEFAPERVSDPEALDLLFMLLYRETRRTIQENDQGNLNLLLTGPIARTILQFQGFGLVSYTKQLQNGLAVRDTQAMLEFLMSMSFAAAAYAAQTNIKSIGREDRDEYLEQQLGEFGTTEGYLKLAAAGFQRSAQSSIVPIMTDMAITRAGFEPVFDRRASGLSTSFDFSASPTGDLFSSAMGAGLGVPRSILDPEYEFSQSTMDDIYRLLPGQNTMPAVLSRQLVIDRIFDLPEKSE